MPDRSAAQGREPTRIPMGGVDKCLLCGWQGQPDEPHGCPRYTDSAATTESREDRDERWIEWTSRAWQHCPLNLYDEHQKLGEVAVGEMLARIHELEAALVVGKYPARKMGEDTVALHD